jgi:AbiV family abortive infection protein
MPSPHGEEYPFDRSIKECLVNAEALLDDAKSLMDKGRYGIAQSLSVLSMEEGAKAVILELANLKLVGEDVIKKSMKNHSPKQVMLVGLEQSKIFLDKKLVGEVTDYVIEDEQALRRLEKPLREGIRNLEKQKQDGLYVDVDPKSGQITSSPNYVGRNDTQVRVSVGRAQNHLFWLVHWLTSFATSVLQVNVVQPSTTFAFWGLVKCNRITRVLSPTSV